MRIAWVIDSVNYNGGAHSATWAMIDALGAHGVNGDVFTLEEPNEVMRDRLKDHSVVVMGSAFPRRGIRHILQGVCNRLHLGWVPNWSIDPNKEWRHKLSEYDAVIVLGENSSLRNLVGAIEGPMKIVLIHTDYSSWRLATEYGKICSRWDRFTYRRFNRIGVVGQLNSERFKHVFPSLSDKVYPFYNLFTLPDRDVKTDIKLSCAKFKIVTISRLNWAPPKNTELYIEVAAKLKAMGLGFDWTVVGDGPEEDVARLRRYAIELGVDDCFHMTGYHPNPIPMVRSADVSTLFSAYEGVANAIYESLLCGVPVIATDVGCAAEQIDDGKTGRVLPLDKDEIVKTMAEVIQDDTIVSGWKENLVGYSYDNEKVVKDFLNLLGYSG